MSADNGIYVLETPKESSSKELEYRVEEAQAIDNLHWKEAHPGEGNPKSVVEYFGGSKVYDRVGADRRTRKLYDAIMKSDFPILEYGICMIRLPHPFSWYEKKVERAKKTNARSTTKK